MATREFLDAFLSFPALKRSMQLLHCREVALIGFDGQIMMGRNTNK